MTDGYRDLADQLAEVGRAAVGRGLVVASGGNLSARCPDREAFVVTGAGTWLDRLAPGSFALVGLDGTVLDGPEPSSEWRLHRATYRVRPDVAAVVHLHPQTAVVLDALGHRVRVLTLDHATYLRRIERVPYFPNGSDELADASAEASRECDVIVLANHGCSTLGPTVEMAWRRALNLEEAAINTFRCLQLGDTDTTFPPDQLGTVQHR
ncbi:MAG TPA: class II aldolase/adducin family protein [Candidatus Limnocylindrales bacterium]|jgi:L-fuculose-phosphate aldolase